MADTTTIQIRNETWRQLNAQKQPGDTFDDVIQRLLSGEDDDVDVGTHETSHVRETEAVGSTTTDRVDKIVADVSASWEDAPERLEARRDAARAALHLAFERGSLSRSEALRDVRPDHDVDGQNDTTWWKKNVQPMLREVGEHYPNRGYVLDVDRDE